MRHHDTVKKFGRVRKQRTALLRGLARSLVMHERIETTLSKAKAVRPFVERLVTKSKVDSVSSRRFIASQMGEDSRVATRLVKTIGPKYKERPGGYTRIIKLGRRGSDSAEMAIIEFV